MIVIIEPVTGDLKNDNELLVEYLSKHGISNNEYTIMQVESGFSTIESEFQGMVNGTHVAMLYKNELPEDCTGVVVDCFDDPGVAACREIGGVPVVGGYQAAIAMASILAERVGVVTTDGPGITNEEKKARAFGFENKVKSIRAIDTPVGDILSDSDSIIDALFDVCIKMEKEDRVTAVCLGCTGMFPVADKLKESLKLAGSKVSVIEPILNAVLTMEKIISMGCGTDTPVEIEFNGYKN